MLYDNLARKLKRLYRSPFEHSISQNQAMWRKRSLHHLPALPPPPPHLVSIGWVRRNWSGVHLHDMPSTWSQSSRSPPSTTTVAHHRPHLLHLDKLGIHNLTIPRSKTTLIKSHSAPLFPFSSCLSVQRKWLTCFASVSMLISCSAFLLFFWVKKVYAVPVLPLRPVLPILRENTFTDWGHWSDCYTRK